MVYNFAIVKFTEEDDALGIVASNWIDDDELSCWYPQTPLNSKKEKMLKMKATPEEGWIQCPIKIIHKFESYNQARSKLKKAEDTSNLETEDENLECKRQRKRSLFLLPGEEEYRCDSDNSDSELVVKYGKNSRTSKYKNNDHLPYPEFNTAKTKKVCNERQLVTKGNQCDRIDSPCLKTNSLSDRDRLLIHQMQATMADMVERFSEFEKKFDDRISSLENRLDSIAKSRSAAEDHMEMDLFHYPFSNMDDLNQFEMALQNESFSKKFSKLLISIVGKDLKSCIKNGLRRTMTDSLAVSFSYTGMNKGRMVGDKQLFCTTRTCRVMHAAIQKVYPQSTEVERKLTMSLWLQQALILTGERKIHWHTLLMNEKLVGKTWSFKCFRVLCFFTVLELSVGIKELSF